MKMKRIKYILLIASAFLFTQCGKDWLELVPQGSSLEDNYYKTDEEVLNGLSAAYDVLQTKYYHTFCSPYFFAQFPSDDGIAGGGSNTDQPGYQAAEYYDMDPLTGNVDALWQNLYFGVYRANVVIDKVLSNEEASANAIAMAGEARFLHAYYYYLLVNFWGDVPYLDYENYNNGNFNIAKTAKADIMDKLVLELLDAIPQLENVSDLSAQEKYRASKGAARTLLGKIYLMQEDWGAAESILSQVNELAEYDLMENYADIWSEQHEFNKESVFEVPYSNLYTVESWGDGRLNFGNIDVKMSGYRNGSAGKTILEGWGYDVVDPRLIKAYNDEGDMVRKNANMYSVRFVFESDSGIYDPQIHVFELYERNLGGAYSTRSDIAGVNCVDSLYFGSKRACWLAEANSSKGSFGFGTNERIFRYADVMLMLAEAKLNNGDPGGAADLVDLVRDRVGLDPVSRPLTYDVLKLERRLELAYEGYRWFDLKRWGDAASVLSVDGFIEGRNDYFPIPESEIVKSGGVLEQYAGYL